MFRNSAEAVLRTSLPVRRGRDKSRTFLRVRTPARFDTLETLWQGPGKWKRCPGACASGQAQGSGRGRIFPRPAESSFRPRGRSQRPLKRVPAPPPAPASEAGRPGAALRARRRRAANAHQAWQPPTSVSGLEGQAGAAARRDPELSSFRCTASSNSSLGPSRRRRPWPAATGSGGSLTGYPRERRRLCKAADVALGWFLPLLTEAVVYVANLSLFSHLYTQSTKGNLWKYFSKQSSV